MTQSIHPSVHPSDSTALPTCHSNGRPSEPTDQRNETPVAFFKSQHRGRFLATTNQPHQGPSNPSLHPRKTNQTDLRAFHFRLSVLTSSHSNTSLAMNAKANASNAGNGGALRVHHGCTHLPCDWRHKLNCSPGTRVLVDILRPQNNQPINKWMNEQVMGTRNVALMLRLALMPCIGALEPVLVVVVVVVAVFCFVNEDCKQSQSRSQSQSQSQSQCQCQSQSQCQSQCQCQCQCLWVPILDPGCRCDVAIAITMDYE